MSESPKVSFHERHQDELDSSAHEIARGYQPEFVAKGSDHFVYRSADHPKVVIKVKSYSFSHGLPWYETHEGDAEAFIADPEIQERIREQIELEKKGYAVLQEYFGREHVLPSRHAVIKVPLTASIREQYPLEAARIPEETYVVSLIQQQVPEIRDGSALSLTAWYANEQSSAYGEEMIRALFPRASETRTPTEVLESFPPGKVRDILRTMPETHAAIIDFVKRACRYSQETGKVLDVAGHDNVVLCQREDQWEYLLVDALSPVLRKNWLDSLRENLKAYVSDPDSFDAERIVQEMGNVINSTNYVRFVNSLSEFFNLDERIDYFSSDISPESFNQVRRALRQFQQAWKVRKRSGEQ